MLLTFVNRLGKDAWVTVVSTLTLDRGTPAIQTTLYVAPKPLGADMFPFGTTVGPELIRDNNLHEFNDVPDSDGVIIRKASLYGTVTASVIQFGTPDDLKYVVITRPQGTKALPPPSSPPPPPQKEEEPPPIWMVGPKAVEVTNSLGKDVYLTVYSRHLKPIAGKGKTVIFVVLSPNQPLGLKIPPKDIICEMIVKPDDIMLVEDLPEADAVGVMAVRTFCSSKNDGPSKRNKFVLSVEVIPETA